MAFGTPRTGSPLTATSTATNTSVTASGSISVSSGDLIVAYIGFTGAGAPTITWSDSNSNSYSNITDVSTLAKAAYFKATSNFTLTSVTATYASNANQKALAVVVYEGPFATSPIDKNPASAPDQVSPFSCPATGTLTQADELILGHYVYVNTSSIISSMASSAPATMSANVESAGTSWIGILQNYKVVSATTSTSNAFTGSNPANAGRVATTSFKKGAAAAALIVKPMLNTLLRM